MLFWRWLFLPVLILFFHAAHAVSFGRLFQSAFKDIQASFDVSQAIHHAPTADFWELVDRLGQIVQRYTDDLLVKTQNKYQDVTGQVDQFKGTINELVTNAEKFRGEIMDSIQEKDITLDTISEELSSLMSTVFDEFEAEFPAPEKAPSHESRVLLVSKLMPKVETAIVGLGEQIGISEERLRTHLGNIRPHVERAVVITGDLAEQHPILLETMIFAGAILIIPEAWFLRPILRLVGFDPFGPRKGSTAALVQSYFYGRSVPRASWFAHLQSAAMKETAWTVWKIIAAIGAALLGVYRSLC